MALPAKQSKKNSDELRNRQEQKEESLLQLSNPSKRNPTVVFNNDNITNVQNHPDLNNKGRRPREGENNKQGNQQQPQVPPNNAATANVNNNNQQQQQNAKSGQKENHAAQKMSNNSNTASAAAYQTILERNQLWNEIVPLSFGSIIVRARAADDDACYGKTALSERCYYLPKEATQENVFAALHPAIKAARDHGETLVLIALGRTNGGKSYTMMRGCGESSEAVGEEEYGVLRRLISALFEGERELPTVCAKIEFLHSDNEPQTKNEKPCHDAEALVKHLQSGLKKRRVGQTKGNATSSRQSAVVTLTGAAANDQQKQFKIVVIDVVGDENQPDSDTSISHNSKAQHNLRDLLKKIVASNASVPKLNKLTVACRVASICKQATRVVALVCVENTDAVNGPWLEWAFERTDDWIV